MWVKADRGVWGLVHIFGGKLYLTRDIVDDNVVPKGFLAPKAAPKAAPKLASKRAKATCIQARQGTYQTCTQPCCRACAVVPHALHVGHWVLF